MEKGGEGVGGEGEADEEEKDEEEGVRKRIGRAFNLFRDTISPVGIRAHRFTPLLL